MTPPEWRLGGHTPDPQARPDVPWLPPPPETIEWWLGGGTEILVWRRAGIDEPADLSGGSGRPTRRGSGRERARGRPPGAADP